MLELDLPIMTGDLQPRHAASCRGELASNYRRAARADPPGS
jgi:hypothetical protein